MVPEVENTLKLSFVAIAIALAACEGDRQHMAEAVPQGDTIPFMTAHGVSNLISDSGYIRYRIVAEEWLIYDNIQGGHKRWTFNKGFFLQRFDEFYIQSDTAFCHDDRLWELRGRVVIKNVNGTVFRSEEFFWDMNAHEVYSNMYVSITEPERNINGYRFRSNEEMTKYIIYDSDGYLPAADIDKQPVDSANVD